MTLCSYSNQLDTSKCFMCLDDSMIIPSNKVCDGEVDCTDLSDECMCMGNSPHICKHVKSFADEIVTLFV